MTVNLDLTMLKSEHLKIETQDKVFEDDYEGKVRDSYLKKIELLDKNGIVKIEDTEGSN